MLKNIFTLLLSGFLFFSTSAQNKTAFNVIKAFHIASSGGWDYISINDNKIYVSHGSQVNILDEKTGDSLGYIPNTTGVHGIAFDNERGKGYTSNGRLNNVIVFDLKTNNVLSQIPTGQNPDAIFYEPFSKKIITCNGRSNDLTVIDPITEKVVATIAVGGKPETAVSDNAGKIYVNIEDKNEIAQINAKTFTIENRWSIAPGDGPTGLVIDKKTKRLFAGCDKLLIVLSTETGKVINKIPIGAGCDGVAFDERDKLIFTSNGEGTMTVIQELSANEFKIVETVTTKPNARTITIDEKTHTLFLPAADTAPADPQSPNARRRPVPGTFQVLVVSQNK